MKLKCNIAINAEEGTASRFYMEPNVNVGMYDVQEHTKWLLEASYYDLVGSDVHNFKHFSSTLSRGRLSKSHIGLIKNINNKNWSQL